MAPPVAEQAASLAVLVVVSVRDNLPAPQMAPSLKQVVPSRSKVMPHIEHPL
jgi:hypothetical protein